MIEYGFTPYLQDFSHVMAALRKVCVIFSGSKLFFYACFQGVRLVVKKHNL